MTTSSVFNIFHNGVTLKVPVDTSALYLQKRLNLPEAPIAVMTPNGTEVPFPITAFDLVSDADVVLITRDNVTEQESKPGALCSFGANGKSGNYVSWGIERFPYNPTYFSKSDDNTTITIKEAGYYHITVKLLNHSGQPCYPYIQINGSAKQCLYGSGPGYQDVQCSFYEKLTENSTLSVSFQTSGSAIYSGTSDIYSYLSVCKIQ